MPLLPQLAAAVTRSLAAVVSAAQQQQQYVAAMMASAGQPGSAQRQQQLREQQPKGLTPEMSAEGTAAAGLLSLLVQLSDQASASAAAAGSGGGGPELPAELEPAAKTAAAAAAADFGGGVVRLPSLGLTLVEACLEVSVGLGAWNEAGAAVWARYGLICGRGSELV